MYMNGQIIHNFDTGKPYRIDCVWPYKVEGSDDLESDYPNHHTNYVDRNGEVWTGHEGDPYSPYEDAPEGGATLEYAEELLKNGDIRPSRTTSLKL